MRTPSSKVVPFSELSHLIRDLRLENRCIVSTNGCFDLLHAGHVDYLERLKERTDVLIVGINSDASVRRLNKGPGRPLLPANERARLVAALRPVDYVTIFSEPTPLKVIRTIRPDFLAKGGDWKKEKIVGRDVVESSGGKVLVLPFVKGHSTTRLIQRIRRLRSGASAP